jgi:hypothetical protein
MAIEDLKSALQRHFPRVHDALMRFQASRIPRSEVFSRFYRTNGWSDPESRSGVGSRMDETIAIRAELPDLFRQLNVRSMLDAPCGDMNWMRHVDLGDIDYTGADIVPQLIADNAQRFPQHRFRVLDLVTEKVPAVDLILCRDCLVHMSLRDAERALRNIIDSGSKYLLTTTFEMEEAHTDIIIGWHRLNLQRPPFSMPKPLRLIDEQSNEQADKRLGLWDLRSLR